MHVALTLTSLQALGGIITARSDFPAIHHDTGQVITLKLGQIILNHYSGTPIGPFSVYFTVNRS